jgi:hypothetical protein
MGHYLLALGRRPYTMTRGEYPVFCGAADAFKASGTTKEHTNMLWRIGGRVYRVRKEGD